MSLKNLYKFDNNANDSVKSNDGTLAGASLPTAQIGRFDQSSGKSSYAFVGGNNTTPGDRQRIELTRSDFEYAGGEPFTWAGWFKISTENVRHTILSNWDGDGNPFQILYMAQNNKVRFFISDGTTDILAESPTDGEFTDGEWHLMVGTYDGDKTAMVYVDGEFEDETVGGATLSGNLFSANAKATIGASYNHLGTNYFWDTDGEIGRVWNFDHELSITEIKQLFNETKHLII